MELEEIMTAVKSVGSRIDDLDNSQKSASENVSNIEKALVERLETLEKAQADIKSDVFDCLQKSVKVNGNSKMENVSKDIGSQFVSNEAFKAMKSSLGRHSSVRVELTASPIGTTASNSVSVNTFASPYNAGVVTDPRAVLNIESLFGKLNVSGSSFTYTHLNDTISTSDTATGPAVVGEGASKPETAYEGQVYLGKIETIAHWTKVTEQLIADDANIVALINNDMQYQVNKLVDKQLLVGTGVGELGGLANSGNYTDYNTLAGLASGDSLIDVVRKVRFAMNANNIDNLTLILNPMDWCAVLGTKNANRDYLIPGIVDLAGQRIYGIPVVLNAGVTSGKYFMGDFFQGAKIFERSGIAVEMDREQDDFTKNLMTLRVERRLGFAVMQPKAIAYGDFAVQP